MIISQGSPIGNRLEGAQAKGEGEEKGKRQHDQEYEEEMLVDETRRYYDELAKNTGKQGNIYTHRRKTMRRRCSTFGRGR